MTRTTTIAALLAAGLGLSACMANDSAMSDNSQLATGVTNPGESPNSGDLVADPTQGIEPGVGE